MVIEIECKKCMKPKPIYKFFKSNTCLDGYNEYCNDCIEEAIKNYIKL